MTLAPTLESRVSPDSGVAGRIRGRRFPAQKVTYVVLGLGVLGLVLFPVVMLVLQSLNVGVPSQIVPTVLGLTNFTAGTLTPTVLWQTLLVAALATVGALVIGTALAWVVTRTDVPGRALIERLAQVPYYISPIVGALAWSVLAAPRTGFLNQVIGAIGGPTTLLNAYTPWGIAWVMTVFEGTVAFVMISASLKSVDPALEESSRALGAGKFKTAVSVTLPLILPGILGALIFVFAEMLGSFAAALVLGLPGRFYVATTLIYLQVNSSPPNYAQAAVIGVVLFIAMGVLMFAYRRVIRSRSYSTISGKGFRPRVLRTGRMRPVLFALCVGYLVLAVGLPFAALTVTSLQKVATVFLDKATWTFDNYLGAFQLAPIRSALGNSVILGVGVATIGVAAMSVLAWLVHRGTLPGRGLVDAVATLPQAVPRVVFGLAILWAWISLPLHLYGTLTLLGIAYFTVFLPLGMRTLGGVVVQVDRSVEECARVCGASWARQMRTVSLPLMRPGVLAAWLLLFIASVRELGASIFLVGPNSKVIGPAIAQTLATSGSQLTAAMSIIQSLTVVVALVILVLSTRRLGAVRTEL